MIDARRLERVATIAVGEGPHGVRFSADGGRAHVAVARAGRVVVIDTGTRQVVREIAVSGSPFWIGVPRS